MKQPSFRFRDTARMLQEWGRNMPRLSGYDEAGGKDDLLAWQRKGRKKLRELIGILPMKNPKPQSWLLEVEKLDSFDREHWAIESPFGDHMFFYRLVPAQQPRAVMFALHGHGTYGADPVAGIMKGRYGEEASYTNANYNYGEEFTKRGYLVYALTQRGFGVRCDLDNPANGPDVPHDTLYPPPGCSCQDINTRAILLGTTDIGLR
ncbi:MAG: alpha/beta hydrolase family protein, partial [Armatimonadota bacterium]